ncbi:uncharacterized protein LOC129746406 [Uranotaenia lowii]|uniref:uncharacterized protein LOC129746406 n=1 Tax=Uranotaenia lowii TaxID=190385 RepID=UPI00247ADF0A|nr:uncharacterized protein LOC129746406 [Uranotaenia lowii]
MMPQPGLTGRTKFSECSSTRLLVLLVLTLAFSSVGYASIFYSGHTLPVPRYRTYFDSVGERRLTSDRFEVTVIFQEDILMKKQCECITSQKCRSPRNIIHLQTRDCHHREKVCCEI